ERAVVLVPEARAGDGDGEFEGANAGDLQGGGCARESGDGRAQVAGGERAGPGAEDAGAAEAARGGGAVDGEVVDPRGCAGTQFERAHDAIPVGLGVLAHGVRVVADIDLVAVIHTDGEAV